MLDICSLTQVFIGYTVIYLKFSRHFAYNSKYEKV